MGIRHLACVCRRCPFCQHSFLSMRAPSTGRPSLQHWCSWWRWEPSTSPAVGQAPGTEARRTLCGTSTWCATRPSLQILMACNCMYPGGAPGCPVLSYVWGRVMGHWGPHSVGCQCGMQSALLNFVNALPLVGLLLLLREVMEIP